jgi:hypothetical protein
MPDCSLDISPTGCAAPIDDLRLIAALDGNVEPALLDHLRSCLYCSTRARSFARLERTLRDRLFRALCPSTTDLLAFQQRALGPERYVVIAEHLRECPHCTHELALLDQATSNALAALGQPSRRIVATLYAPHPLPFGPSIYGTSRSAASNAHYVFRAENVQLTVSAAYTLGRPGHVMLNGMLIIGDDLSDTIASGTASLLTAGHVIRSVPIDNSGCFTLDDVPSGEHTLSLRLHECEIVVETLML